MSTPEYSTILYEVEKKVLRITLNRPEKRNALNEVMIRELRDIFLHFEDNKDIIGVLVTGAGESFCAGADLSYLQSLINKSYEENLKDSLNLKDMYWTIYNFPKPTVGLINGPAIAGGCGLISVLDIAIASKNAIFGYPEVKIGFVASIVSVFLIQTVGFAQAKKMLLTGELIDSAEAEKRGLIHQIVKEGKLSRASKEVFSQIRKNSPQAMSQTKQLLRDHQGNIIEKMLEQACTVNAKSRQTSNFKEGLQSFLDKRRPNWGEL
jgi:methylglutaconyl-CoA hydratase